MAEPKEGKVTLRDRPTEQVIKDSLKETIITDSRGRKIRLVRPSILAQFKLVQLVGGETASNTVYMGMILPLLFVAAIDGEAVSFPARPNEIDALIQRLDEDGVVAVAQGVAEHFAPADPAEERAAVKNSQDDQS